MKSLLFTMLCLLFVVSSSCKKDDCVPGNLDTTIVGSWSVKALGLSLGDVQFHANGTLTDPDDVLIGGEVGGEVLSVKTYTVGSNTAFNVRAENASGSSSLDFDYDVTSYNCDEIVLDVIGIETTMSRK
ncbi:MAG TPA: hypothetical protein VFG10_15780 [Saprospiraceae bacterium]|nr:hypothetical protein [Saprospiraceae bacterium]